MYFDHCQSPNWLNTFGKITSMEDETEKGFVAELSRHHAANRLRAKEVVGSVAPFSLCGDLGSISFVLGNFLVLSRLLTMSYKQTFMYSTQVRSVCSINK